MLQMYPIFFTICRWMMFDTLVDFVFSLIYFFDGSRMLW